MNELLERIEQVLDGEIRPQLLLHGGGMETVRLEGGRYVFRLTGQCAGCPSAYLTTEELIRGTLLERFPQLREVVLEQGVSADLLAQAKRLLCHE
ncbi:MAG: hypothetical protein BHV94_06420 [Clostridiales bacterium 59_14]|nr:MAG: hypothetical protein BHV94_06420 [Clostridiales bacterium 59_14]